MWQFQPKPGHLQSPSGLSVIYEIASSHDIRCFSRTCDRLVTAIRYSTPAGLCKYSTGAETLSFRLFSAPTANGRELYTFAGNVWQYGRKRSWKTTAPF